MALTSYTELQASVSEFANRADLSPALLADFIVLAESEFNNRLRMVDQENYADFTITGRITPLFADLAQIRSIEYKGSPVKPMSYASPEVMSRLVTTGGAPLFYSQRGVWIEVLPIQTNTVVTMTYWRKIPALTTFEPTNWLLQAHPNLYLYETLRQVAIWAKDDASIVRYGDLLASYMRKLEVADTNRRFGGTSLAMRTA
jgi:hypothetical protein